MKLRNNYTTQITMMTNVSIAPNIQNIKLQDKAIGNEDLHPDFNENYDLSGDLGIPSASFNNEPLILNELPDDDYRQMVRI